MICSTLTNIYFKTIFSQEKQTSKKPKIENDSGLRRSIQNIYSDFEPFLYKL